MICVKATVRGRPPAQCGRRAPSHPHPRVRARHRSCRYRPPAPPRPRSEAASWVRAGRPAAPAPRRAAPRAVAAEQESETQTTMHMGEAQLPWLGSSGATSPSWFGVSREAQVPVTSPLITGQRGSHSTPNVHTQRTPIRPRAWPQRAAVTWPGMPGLALWLEWGHVVSHPLKGTRGPRLTSQSRTTGAGRRPWGAVTPRLAPGSEGTPALSYARRTLPFPGLTTLPSMQRAVCLALPAAPLHSLEAWPRPRQTQAWFPRTAGHSRRCRLALHGPLRPAGPGGRACVTCSAGRGRARGWTRPSYSHTRCLRRRRSVTFQG